MWVVEVPGAGGRDIAVLQQRVRRRRRFRHMRGGPAAANGTLPPVDVVVRCAAGACDHLNLNSACTYDD
jgi:hypothetical protein